MSAVAQPGGRDYSLIVRSAKMLHNQGHLYDPNAHATHLRFQKEIKCRHYGKTNLLTYAESAPSRTEHG